MKQAVVCLVFLVLIEAFFLSDWGHDADIKTSPEIRTMEARYLLQSYGYNEEQILNIIGTH